MSEQKQSSLTPYRVQWDEFCSDWAIWTRQDDTPGSRNNWRVCGFQTETEAISFCVAANEHAALCAVAESAKPLARLSVEQCGSCDGRGHKNPKSPNDACGQCGGIGRVVVGFPDANDVELLRAALTKVQTTLP